MVWFQQNAAVLLAGLFGISEILAQIPSVKANSVFQLIFGVIKQLSGRK